MHGLGNDFVVVNCLQEQERDWSVLAPRLLDRNFGIGGDQLLLIKESKMYDFFMQLFNTDGFEAEMCGNGIRCVARFIMDNKLSSKEELSIDTLGGMKKVKKTQSGDYQVSMGVPRHVGEHKSVSVGPLSLDLTEINMGNPHAVCFVEKEEVLKSFDLAKHGKDVESNTAIFPNRTNFEMCYFNKEEKAIDVKVYERSAGITLACGSGATAVASAAVLKGLFDFKEKILIRLPGGNLSICWPSKEEEIIMTGPAERVFEGTIEI